MAIFAYYGPFVFQTLLSPEDFSSDRDYEYAEHKIVENIGRMQWTGDNNEELEMDGLFHFTFCDPLVEMAALYALAEAHLAQALVYGTGEFRGYFVITKLHVDYQQFSADGRLETTKFQVKFKGVPYSQIYSSLNPPTPGHQPWALVDESQSGGQQTLQLPQVPVDGPAATAIFGGVPNATIVSTLSLPAPSTGLSVITANLPPTAPPPGVIDPSSVSVGSIVRAEL